jgi:sortase (surface protein transpeptidase)
MHNRKFFNILLSASTIIMGTFCVFRILALTAQASAVEANALRLSSVPPVVERTAPAALVAQSQQPKPPVVINDPVNLSIPNARVNAHVIPVGVTKTGNLDVPPNFVEVGWYKYGTKPGQVGNAVLDGHVDNGGSIDGVFKHLRDLNPGDDIFVNGADGAQLHFKVVHSDIYLTSKFPSDVVFNENDGKPILKIITCHGTYVPSTKTYDHRLVVTAELVS